MATLAQSLVENSSKSGQLLFSKPGTYTFSLPYDANVTALVIGGGGGGGACCSDANKALSQYTSCGGGGAGLGLGVYKCLANQVYVITIGSGGTRGGLSSGIMTSNAPAAPYNTSAYQAFGNGSYNGGAGGSSSFSSFLTCTGGSGGLGVLNNTSNSGATGGTSTGHNIYGANGGRGGSTIARGNFHGSTGGGGLCGANGGDIIQSLTFCPGTAGGGMYPGGKGGDYIPTSYADNNSCMDAGGGGINYSGGNIVNNTDTLSRGGAGLFSSPTYPTTTTILNAVDLNFTNPGDTDSTAGYGGGGGGSSVNQRMGGSFIPFLENTIPPHLHMVYRLFKVLKGSSGGDGAVGTTHVSFTLMGGSSNTGKHSSTVNVSQGSASALFGGTSCIEAEIGPLWFIGGYGSGGGGTSHYSGYVNTIYNAGVGGAGGSGLVYLEW